MADINTLSLTCDEQGNVWEHWHGHEPRLVLAWDLPRELRVLHYDEIVALPGHADAQKGSALRHVTIYVRRLVGGIEDVSDFNRRCLDVDLFIAEADCRQSRYCLTAKGGSDGLRIHIGRLIGPAREVEFDLGNRSEQSNARTKNVEITVGEANFGPVRCRVQHAWRPKLGGNVKWKMDTRLMGWVRFFWFLFPIIWR